jgi:hypothetical protein
VGKRHMDFFLKFEQINALHINISQITVKNICNV